MEKRKEPIRHKYFVPKAGEKKAVTVTVPGSKSITNRALLLAALSCGECLLKGVLFSDDSRAVLSCLQELGFDLTVEEEKKQVRIIGTGGNIPNKKASVNVRSAGTAARFLTVMLAFSGGDYILNASEQMKKRPMEPLLSVLREAGVKITCMEEEGHFPFRIQSEKPELSQVTIDTTVSSQFASALLMTGILLKPGLRVHMEGSRAKGAYIKITLELMRQFGIPVREEGNTCIVPGGICFQKPEYQIEPDMSGACYFYAMAPLLRKDITVRDVHEASIQGDKKFLELLVSMGCRMEDGKDGICIRGSHLTGYPGLTVDMKDFSDQTMTLAAIAPFADAKTLIQNIGHIRFQESDRIHAILSELTRLGIHCEEVPEAEGIRIYPGEVKEGEVETYDDHRMAMAFTLIGLRTGKVTIKNPECCQKTFENYFEIIDSLF